VIVEGCSVEKNCRITDNYREMKVDRLIGPDKLEDGERQGITGDEIVRIN
jgi:hypothetical protein